MTEEEDAIQKASEAKIQVPRSHPQATGRMVTFVELLAEIAELKQQNAELVAERDRLSRELISASYNAAEWELDCMTAEAGEKHLAEKLHAEQKAHGETEKSLHETCISLGEAEKMIATLRTRAEKAESERDFLLAGTKHMADITARLPKSLDGVALAPGMEAWVICEDTVVNVGVGTLHDSDDWELPTEVYSTREAAEAARKAVSK